MSIGWKETELIQTVLYTLCANWYTTSIQKEDITFSTHSMFIAFSLLYIGSNGETKKQIGEVFGFSKFSDEVLQNLLFELIHHNEEANEIIVQIVNGIWLTKNSAFKAEYLEAVKKLNCRVENADFVTNSENIRKDINLFVEETTRNVIKDFLQPGSVTADTVSIIVNAIYFKGEWNDPFDIMDEPFIFNGKEEVIGMKKKIKCGAIFDELYTTVSIPYKDMNHSMIIIMPENMDQFEEKYMDKNDKECLLKEIFRNTRQEFPEKRLVKMPKFKIESSFSMNEQLVKLGLTNPFGISADFGKMTDEKIMISNALHKCVVDVDEKGTEAAAATGIMMMRMAMAMDKPKDVIIDKPFFFAIVGGEMNIPLFFGKITHPKH